MKAVPIAQLKAHLSEHLRTVRSGETVTVLDRDRPIARIIPYDGDDDDLVVVRGRGKLRDVQLHEIRPVSGGDILEDLRAERADRE